MQIRFEGEWSSFSRTVSVLAAGADHDVGRQQSEICTFVAHEIEGEAIVVELLSGSTAQRFEEFLNATRTSRANQQPEGVRPAPSAPPLPEVESEHRYYKCKKLT